MSSEAPVELVLCDLEQGITDACLLYFWDLDRVRVVAGDPLGHPADAIVSGPSNGFGFMDSALDLRLVERFGPALRERLQREVARHFDGEMFVGQAAVVETGGPLLISAPTTRVPLEPAGHVGAYLAFRAALRAVEAYNRALPGAIRTVVSGPLWIGSRTPPELCAKQMAAAYRDVLAGPRSPATPSEILLHHCELMRPD